MFKCVSECVLLYPKGAPSEDMTHPDGLHTWHPCTHAHTLTYSDFSRADTHESAGVCGWHMQMQPTKHTLKLCNPLTHLQNIHVKNLYSTY